MALGNWYIPTGQCTKDTFTTMKLTSKGTQSLQTETVTVAIGKKVNSKDSVHTVSLREDGTQDDGSRTRNVVRGKNTIPLETCTSGSSSGMKDTGKAHVTWS